MELYTVILDKVVLQNLLQAEALEMWRLFQGNAHILTDTQYEAQKEVKP